MVTIVISSISHCQSGASCHHLTCHRREGRTDHSCWSGQDQTGTASGERSSPRTPPTVGSHSPAPSPAGRPSCRLSARWPIWKVSGCEQNRDNKNLTDSVTPKEYVELPISRWEISERKLFIYCIIICWFHYIEHVKVLEEYIITKVVIFEFLSQVKSSVDSRQLQTKNTGFN